MKTPSLELTRRIHIRKEALKFSAAHMTVFPDGSKEALHGHNFTVQLVLDIGNSGSVMIPFSDIKSLLAKLCEDWDEKVLIATRCSLLRGMKSNGKSISFTLCGKKYVLPEDEVILLPTDNITSESLAEIFCARLLARLKSKKFFDQIKKAVLKIEESPGQGSSATWVRPTGR